MVRTLYVYYENIVRMLKYIEVVCDLLNKPCYQVWHIMIDVVQNLIAGNFLYSMEICAGLTGFVMMVPTIRCGEGHIACARVIVS